MAPLNRTRSFTRLKANGYYTYNNVTYPQAAIGWLFKRTDDVIKKAKRPNGTTPPSALSIYERTISGGILNHVTHQHTPNKPQPTRVIAGCQATIQGATGHSQPPGGGWASMEGTSAELTAKLLSHTNPFRYEVSVPVMVAELIEAASLLDFIKRSVAGTVGSAYIVEQWGYDPMIADIRALSKITSAIETRIKEFNSLLKKGGLRRKVLLTSKTVRGTPAVRAIWSAAAIGFDGVATPIYRTKVWGTVRWIPNRNSPIDLARLSQFNEAARIVLDLRRPDASTIWEAIPWSWLVDYFLNVGDSLQALEDTDKVIPTDVCIMRERWVELETTLVPEGWHNAADGVRSYQTNFSPGVVKHHYKLREVRSASSLGDLLSFGIMSKRQATNLLFLLLSFRGKKLI